MNATMVSTRIALNMDIMLAILSASPPKTATSIMETCHFLYHEGAKILLKRPVFLGGSEHTILSLLRFIQAEDLTRCSYVRTLSISSHKFSEVAAKLLADLVPRMSKLVILYLEVESLFHAFPYLLPVFASLRSVKILSVKQAGPKSCDLVRTLQSELVAATIMFGRFGTYPSVVFGQPLYLLWRSASTLQHISCTTWSATHANSETIMSSPRIIYPKVRSLILHGLGNAPCLAPYIQAFPNLAYLKLDGPCSPMLQSSQDQGQMPNVVLRGRTGEPLVWKHIQSFTGSIPDLRALRLAFPIPRLNLSAVSGGSSAPLRLTEVLASARPMHLTIGFEDQPFSGSLMPEFLAALSSEGASGLCSVAFTIEVMAADVDGSLDVGQFWASIGTIFSRLPLCDVNIVMRDISLPHASIASTPFPSPNGGDQRAIAHNNRVATFDVAPGPGQWVEESPSQDEHRTLFTLAERTLEDFDVRAFVGRLAASIPTLRNAAVSVPRPSRWGGGVRSARLCKAETLACTGGDSDVLYEEVGESLEQVRQRSDKRRWASLSRAWNRGLSQGRILAELRVST